MAKKNVQENKAVRRHPILLSLLAIVALLALAVYMLYPVTRDFYVAYRENSRLAAEYSAVVDRNEKIQELLDFLKTQEGIEDIAREQFGWVLEGERAVNITGLDITENSMSLPAFIEPGSVEAPEYWWTVILDKFFGVEEPALANPYPDDIIPGL